MSIDKALEERIAALNTALTQAEQEILKLPEIVTADVTIFVVDASVALMLSLEEPDRGLYVRYKECEAWQHWPRAPLRIRRALAYGLEALIAEARKNYVFLNQDLTCSITNVNNLLRKLHEGRL